MPLSVPAIKAAQSKEKDYKLFDDKGLFILVKVSGAKYWRLKYRFAGKEKLLSLGVFPEVTLTQARVKRDEARSILREGRDPSDTAKSKARRAPGDCANTFEAVARDWLVRRGQKSISGDARMLRLLEGDLFPQIGRLPIREISAPILLSALRKIESRGAIESARRAKQYAGQVFRYAIATGVADRDPTPDLVGALATPKTAHHSAITDPRGAGKLMAAIEGYSGTPTVKAALQLTALFFCRQGELRYMEWSEINWDENRIEIPAARMKGGDDHIIPLSRQAREILMALEAEKRSKYVFPSAKGASRPLSENAVRAALRTMGYGNDDMTPHGFRAMARTLLDEVLHYRIEWIEQQLAHTVKDFHGRAYNRTKHLDERARMMQAWADYLDGLKQNTLPNNF